MLNHPINRLPGVAKILLQLAKTYKLVLNTKGYLLHQEQKLAQSGLEHCFKHVHVLIKKQTTTYCRIFLVLTLVSLRWSAIQRNQIHASTLCRRRCNPRSSPL